MRILNLTQHHASADQVSAGVVEPADKKEVQATLTFVGMPRSAEVVERAKTLAAMAVAEGVDAVMVGGAPYLMGPLERALLENGIRALYAFSERQSVEATGPDGSVVKKNVFVHLGFVEAAL